MSVETDILTRRDALKAIAGTAAFTLSSGVHAKAFPPVPRTGMGLVMYDCRLRRDHLRKRDPKFDLFAPRNFLRHCVQVGAGGMQVALGRMSTTEATALRRDAEERSLYIEAIVKLPKSKTDLERFEDELRTARKVNALAARCTIIPGRRYERFSTYAEFREFERRGEAMLERAAPVAEKHQIPLAVENHKDQRLEDRVRLLTRLDSEYVGACVDTGNSFALLDGAYEPIEALAPFARSVHLKDQALQATDDGFLLGDIPLGQGSFDLRRMVATLRKARPDIRFSLELITRDPLRVPCLTEAFYAPLPNVPASDLAKTLRFVRQHPANHLQQVSTLDAARQVALEDANVRESITYAAEELKL